MLVSSTDKARGCNRIRAVHQIMKTGQIQIWTKMAVLTLPQRGPGTPGSGLCSQWSSLFRWNKSLLCHLIWRCCCPAQTVGTTSQCLQRDNRCFMLLYKNEYCKYTLRAMTSELSLIPPHSISQIPTNRVYWGLTGLVSFWSSEHCVRSSENLLWGPFLSAAGHMSSLFLLIQSHGDATHQVHKPCCWWKQFFQ